MTVVYMVKRQNVLYPIDIVKYCSNKYLYRRLKYWYRFFNSINTNSVKSCERLSAEQAKI